MLSLALTPLRTTIYGAVCASLLSCLPGIAAAQPPPGGGAIIGPSTGPSGLPPELQKISTEFARANKLFAAKQYADARSAYESFIHLAIIAKLNESAILSAYSNIAVIDHTLGDNKGYLETLRKIVDLDPKNATAFAQLALVESLEKHYDLAEQHANKAIALNSSKGVGSTAHFVKGNVAVYHKDFAGAAKEFGEASRLLPTNVMAHFNCGLALAELKRYPEAQKELETAHNLDPKSERVNDYLAKLKAYLVSLKAQPTPTAPDSPFDAILKKDPHNGPALLGRARIIAQTGHVNEAIAAYIQATLAMPDPFDSHFELAHLYLNTTIKEYSHAKDHYLRAQQIAEKASNEVNSGKAFGGLAESDMEEGLDNQDYRLKTQGLTAAETHIKAAIAADPKQPEFKSLLARIYEHQSRYKDAANIYRELLAASPGNMPLYARLADTCKAVRDIPGFVKIWKEYQALKPDDPNSYEYITEIYNQTGMYQEAYDTLKEMLTRKVTNSVIASAMVIQAQDLVELKRVDEARAEFKKVLELTPSKVPSSFVLNEKAALDTAQRAGLKALAGEDAKENKFDDAIGHLIELKKREAEIYQSAHQPPNGEVYKNIATLYEQSKRLEKAVDENSEMARARPEDPVPHEEMGRLLDLLKKTDAAAVQYRIASKLNTTDPVQDALKISDMYQRNGMNDKALTELEALKKAFPRKVEVLTALALIYRRTKQDEKALEIYNAIIKNNPSQGWVQDARADLYVNLHQYKQAEKVYVEEITRNPRAGRQTYASLARVYDLEGRANEFLGFMKPWFEKDVSNSVAMAVVYDEFKRQNHEAEGQAYITGVIEKTGAIRRSCMQAYAVLLQLNNHKAESLDIYRRIAKENPKDISAWIGLAEQLDYNGLHDEANLVFVDQAARKDVSADDLFTLRYKLAGRYFQQGKKVEARAVYQTMFNNNNKNFDVAMRLGDFIATTGTSDETIAFYKNLLGIPTYIPQVILDIHDRLGIEYEKSNKRDDAIAQFNESLKLDKDDATANTHLKKLQGNPASASTQ